MPVGDAIKLWLSEGKPVIHLSHGINCIDLVAKLLSRTDVSAEHLEAVRTWLSAHCQIKPGGNGQ